MEIMANFQTLMMAMRSAGMLPAQIHRLIPEKYFNGREARDSSYPHLCSHSINPHSSLVGTLDGFDRHIRSLFVKFKYQKYLTKMEVVV